MKKKFQKTVFSTSLLIVGAGSFIPAIPAIAAPQESAAILEEIIVNARRREEALQDVPVSITAFSGEFLRDNNIESFDDVQYHVPGLQITQTGTSGQVPVIALRGQRPTEAIISIEPAVHLYFNEVVISPSDGANISLFDLENVQVLKGPQGTLFGRNSTGGAVLFSPTRPGEEFGGYVQAGVGNYDLFETEFGVNLPISEGLKSRLSGKYVERDGYVENVCGDPAFNSNLCTGGEDELFDDHSKSVRFSLLANPTDYLENYTVLSYDESDPAGRKPALVLQDPNHPDTGFVQTFLIDQGLITDQPGLADPSIIETDVSDHFDKVRAKTVSNTTTLEIGELTLRNIFGYRKVEHDWTVDLDGTGFPLVFSPPDDPIHLEAESFSEELQVQGVALEDRLQWIAGVYFYKLDGDRKNVIQAFPADILINNVSVDNDSSAVYFQGTYDFSEQWSATLGARRSWDKRAIRVGDTENGACDTEDADGMVLPDDSCSISNSEKWAANTWQASLTYNLSENTMYYGSIATGYRAGGFNMRAKSVGELVPFDEENVKTYELGLKAQWELGEVQIRNNLAVYLQDYTDIQVTTAVDNDGGFDLVSLTDNAAEATVKGIDYEVTLIPVDGLSISINYALVDTEYDDYMDTTFTDIPDPMNPPNGFPVEDRSGQEFLWIPRESVTTTIRYTLPLDSSIGEISLQANVYYQGKMRRQINFPDVDDSLENRVTIQGSYSVENYQIDWLSIMGSSIDVSLWVKNASDEEYVVGGQTVLSQLGSVLYNFGAPKTYGASLTYMF